MAVRPSNPWTASALLGTMSSMWTRLEHQEPLIIFLGLMFTLLSAAIAAHFILTAKRVNESLRKAASWVAVAVSTIAALAVTMAFGIPVLGEFRHTHVPFRETLLAVTLVWAICLGMWVIAMRCVIFALRR